MIDSPYMASTGRSTAAIPRARRSAASRKSRPATASTRTTAMRLGHGLAVCGRSSSAATGAAATAGIVTERAGAMPRTRSPIERAGAKRLPFGETVEAEPQESDSVGHVGLADACGWAARHYAVGAARTALAGGGGAAQRRSGL